MAKGNGSTRGTRVSAIRAYQGEVLYATDAEMKALYDVERNTPIEEDRRKFLSYDSGWEHTYFDERTGGYLVTQSPRKYKPMSKNEREVFEKEQEMGMRYAMFGFQIEHLNEIPGISSPDAKVRREGTKFRVNGKTADFKRLSSDNKIYSEGKDARFKKGARLVMYEFTGHFSGVTRSIEKLRSKGIHGYYYYSDENGYHSF